MTKQYPIDGCSRRHFLTRMAGVTSLGVFSHFVQAGEKGKGQRPNIVFILADDMGYGDVGCYGCPDIKTPHIDRIAARGVRFTNFYANAPECTPTRTAIMTGRYQHRVGGLECALGVGNVGRYDDAIRLRETHDLGLPVQETSIARMLKDAGYATGICGKWHLGYEEKFNPLKHGFDYFIGPIGGNCDYFHHTELGGYYALYQNEKPVHRDQYMTDLITEESVKFIERQKENPFFLYVTYTAPHSPYQGPDDKPEKPVSDENFNKGTRETYVEMVERMDEGIGRIVETLEEKGFLDNTLLIFMSDNGANNKGRNAPFSGHKGGLFEGGIRVPCAVQWPGVIPEGIISDQMGIGMDLSASIIRAAGAQIPAGREFDGVDILKWVENQKPETERTLFWRARRGDRTWRAVRDGKMKYISRQDGDEFQEYLFDLQDDPAEKQNLISNRPKETARLKKLLAEWEREVKPVR